MLGEKIQRLRKERGMTQEELSGQLTVSRQAISKWELGESVPDTENVVQLSKLFNVSTDYLLHDDYMHDMDIPAVKTSTENLITAHKNKTKLTAYFRIGFGLLPLLLLAAYEMTVARIPVEITPYQHLDVIELYNPLAIVISLFGILLLVGIVMLLRVHGVFGKKAH